MPPAHPRDLAKTIDRRRISFQLCCRWLSEKDRTSKFTEPTTTRQMEPVFAITFTSSISPTRIFGLLPKPPAAFCNPGTGGGSAVGKVNKPCRKITGRNLETIEKPRRPGDPPRLIASSERIKKELGWKPQFQSLNEIIESAWKWHRKFPRGYENKAGKRGCCSAR